MRHHAILDVCWSSLVTTTSGREPFALDDEGFAQLETAIAAHRNAVDVDHVKATLAHVAAFLDEEGACGASEDILALAARLSVSQERGRLRLLPPLENEDEALDAASVVEDDFATADFANTDFTTADFATAEVASGERPAKRKRAARVPFATVRKRAL
jgi:hypothetical protein